MYYLKPKKTITWSILRSDPLKKCDLNAYSNLYYPIDHLYSIPYEAVSQYVDTNGKCRSITFQTNSDFVTIYTIPCQPENIPTTNEYYFPSHTLVESIFGTPTSITTHLDKHGEIQTDGYWYRVLDIQNGEYIPIQPYKSKNQNWISTNKPDFGIRQSKESITGRYQSLQHISNIIINIIQWLYVIEKDTNKKITPTSFSKKYFETPPKSKTSHVIDSATFYNLFSIKRKLPIASSISSAMEAIDPELKTNLFTKKKKILLYDTTFYDRMVSILVHFEKMYPNYPPHYTVLYNALENKENFIVNPNTKLFLSVHDINQWLISNKIIRNYGKYYSIYDTISYDLKNFKQPFVFKDDDEYYLIKNSDFGVVTSKEKSLETASEWWYPCNNMGKLNLENYMVYGISSSLKIEPFFDHTKKGFNRLYKNIILWGL